MQFFVMWVYLLIGAFVVGIIDTYRSCDDPEPYTIGAEVARVVVWPAIVFVVVVVLDPPGCDDEGGMIGPS